MISQPSLPHLTFSVSVESFTQTMLENESTHQNSSYTPVTLAGILRQRVQRSLGELGYGSLEDDKPTPHELHFLVSDAHILLNAISIFLVVVSCTREELGVQISARLEENVLSFMFQSDHSENVLSKTSPPLNDAQESRIGNMILDRLKVDIERNNRRYR